MSNNPQPPGTQPPHPALNGSGGSQNFSPMQQFISAGPQQFCPIAQGIYPGNVGIAPCPYHHIRYLQQMQQGPPRPGQPWFGPPSTQAFSMPYAQPNMSANPSGGQQWLSSGNQSLPLAAPVEQTGQKPSMMVATDLATAGQPNSTIQSSSDWEEHTSADGRRYYYNEKMEQSSWEKPLELMTILERADASTAWKEFTTPEGKKYYYNKVTGISKWKIPEELQLAREQAEKESTQGIQPEASVIAHAPVAGDVSKVEIPSSSFGASAVVTSSPVLVTTIVTAASPLPVMALGSQSAPVGHTSVSTDAVGSHSPVASVTSSHASSGGTEVSGSLDTSTTPTNSEINCPQDVANAANGASGME